MIKGFASANCPMNRNEAVSHMADAGNAGERGHGGGAATIGYERGTAGGFRGIQPPRQSVLAQYGRCSQ